VRVSTTQIAWRNLWRNPRRTGLALAAIAISTALVLTYNGVLRAYGDWMVATITGPMLGDLQVHAPGWRKDRGLERTLPEATATLHALRGDAEVADAAARIYAPALVARGDEGFAAVVVGLEPAIEAGPMGLLETAPARPAGRGVLIGRKLAQTMSVRVGDELALVGQAVDGSFANDLYAVTALIDTPVDLINRQAVVMELGEAQRLFVMTDEVHEIVVRARDPDRGPVLARRLATALPGAEVMDWRALAPDLVSLVELVNVAWVFVLVLVFVAAAAGIANTMLISTFERTRELGMLLALGVPPARIVAMLVVEAVALGVVGVALGFLAGTSIVATFHRVGFDLAQLTGGGPAQISFAGMSWSLRLYPSLAPIDLLRTFTAVVVTAVVSSLWPAIRAARLQPATAMRA
jgi:ABC-type lipoprotein release transport system permease subunit